MKIYRYFKKEDERFAKSFVEQGSIRLMPFLYYRQLEDKKRRDLNDGKQVYHPEDNTYSLFVNGQKLPVARLKVEHRDKDDQCWAISCFSKSNSLDKFGEICVTIHDREELVNRVKAFFGISNYPEIVCSDVIYYDPKLSQQTTSHSFLYKEKEAFGEEQEFRVCVNFKEVLRVNQIKKLEVINIDVGSLEDIASINFNN